MICCVGRFCEKCYVRCLDLEDNGVLYKDSGGRKNLFSRKSRKGCRTISIGSMASLPPIGVREAGLVLFVWR